MLSWFLGHSAAGRTESMKNPYYLKGESKPRPIRLVARCLNHLRHRVPQTSISQDVIFARTGLCLPLVHIYMYIHISILIWQENECCCTPKFAICFHEPWICTNFWNAKQDTVSHNSIRLHPATALIVLIKRNMQHPFSINVSKYQNSIIQRREPSFEIYWGKSSIFNRQNNKCTRPIQSRVGQSVYKPGTWKLLKCKVIPLQARCGPGGG